MKLPKSFMKRYPRGGRVTQMFGVPIEKLSKEELLACVDFLVEDTINTRERHSKTIGTLNEIYRARP